MNSWYSIVLLLCLHQLVAIGAVCPGDAFTDKVPIHFGYVAGIHEDSSFLSSGTIPAVQLALERINDNSSLLYGYDLSYGGQVYDARVRSGAY